MVKHIVMWQIEGVNGLTKTQRQPYKSNNH